MRLGDTTTPGTKNLSLRKLQAKKKNRPKLKKADWLEIDSLMSKALAAHDDLDELVDNYCDYRPGLQEILDYIEFEAPEYFSNFRVPKDKDGRNVKGRGPLYL